MQHARLEFSLGHCHTYESGRLGRAIVAGGESKTAPCTDQLEEYFTSTQGEVGKQVYNALLYLAECSIILSTHSVI